MCDKSSETDRDLWLRNFEEALKLCPNLTKLSLNDCNLDCKDMQVLKNAIRSIKEMQIYNCTEIDWSDCSVPWREGLSQLEQITVSFSYYSFDLFKQCMNLSALEIEFFFESIDWPKEHFAYLFDHIGHCLKQLAIKSYSNKRSTGIATLISEKLPYLTTLKLNFLSNTVNTICQLPHLKHLEILYHPEFELPSCNLLMRKLSDCGIIEKLVIQNKAFDDEDINEPPLLFNQLQSFHWSSKHPSLSLLKAITKAQMPKITEFIFEQMKSDENMEMHAVLAFVQSKITLNSINLKLCFQNKFEIVRGIIEILKTQSRSLLYLNLHYKFFGVEEVSKHDTVCLIP